jgi:hypothetical protein
MMTNPENQACGSPAPQDEHDQAIIVAGSRSSGQSTRLASAVIDQTTKLAGQAGQQVIWLMTEQKNRAADGLHRLACALRVTTQNRGQNDVGGQIATYTNRAGARIESMSTYMRGADFPTMLRDAGQFARRRPEVVLAGAILTGLLVASLLKASGRGAAEPWTSATGRWHAVLQKGTQAVSAAADTLKQGAEARGLSPEAVVEKVTGSRLGRYVAIPGNRQWRKS